jgi:hypothetical protein
VAMIIAVTIAVVANLIVETVVIVANIVCVREDFVNEQNPS